jgi:adenylate cyclase
LKRRLTAILAADIVNYSKLVGQDQVGTLDALRQFRSKHFEPSVTGYSGTVIKRLGDGWIVEFGSVTDAVSCALQVQQGLDGHELIQLRVGIHIGDVVFDEEDVFGDGVNVAARLETLAKPGEVLISDTAYNSLDSKASQQFRGGDPHQLKNIVRPVNVWCWPAQATSITEPLKSKALPPQDKRAIAVLPFDNMSGDPKQDYFTDGISEDIITDLSKINSLFVIARNSSFAYKGKAVDIPTIARELGVQFVLEGSVRRGGSRVRINAQLIDAESGGHLWAERYDREMTDIFEVQDEVTENIVKALSITLGKEEGRLVGVKITGNLAAYECVLRGRDLLLRGQLENRSLTKETLEQAIKLDPGLGVAYAYLALTHLVEYINGWSEASQPTLKLAHDLARKGVALTPDNAHVHIALGSVYLALRQHDDAIAEAEHAIQLSPNYAHGLFELGWYLQYAGRADESLAYFDRAIRLDPYHSEFFLHFMAQAYFQLERYEEAANLLRRRLVQNPHTDASRMLLAACYGYLDKNDAARALWEELKEITPDFSLEQRREVLPYKNPEDFEKIVIGLRKSGLPPDHL